MSQLSKTIAKNPVLGPAEDFYRLREEGIGHIERLASELWTDYNVHDPGITILEALCYAITDLAYRMGWDIRDILAPESAPDDSAQPYPGQAFFTAREILTINPTAPDDFRRLLIDLQEVRNAWVICKKCACDLNYYAWHDKQKKLQLGYQAPLTDDPDDPKPELISPKGLYDVLLELEADPVLGDLNDRKIEYKTTFHDDNGTSHISLELRFPDISVSEGETWREVLDSEGALVSSVTLTKLGATKSFDVFTDPGMRDDDDRDSYIRAHWRNVLFLDLKVEFTLALPDKPPPNRVLPINNIGLRIYAKPAQGFASWFASPGGAKKIKKLLESEGSEAFIKPYLSKIKTARKAIEKAKTRLHECRNLDEDYCCIRIAGIEEVSVCADVEVRPDADIEYVQARIWFEIEQYFNAPIRFRCLNELLEGGVAVEEIFNGPALDCGFITADNLEAASLKQMLRTSDIINRLMDVEGVVSVNRLLMTKYDSEGNVVRGAADPRWESGKPVFDDPGKTSASWSLLISAQHQPRLYLNASRFLFLKNGLPFLPRMDEASSTLSQLRGVAERPKNINAEKDLNIPDGSFRNPEEYHPVQYSFPQAYGIGIYGLPSPASELRKAQARQLKAYLMVFEQLLGNALAQLANTAKLFSLDPDIDRTYFVKEFSEKLIKGYDEIKKDLDISKLKAITEREPEFHERRNRFLDHLLARFGEQFSEYAMMLTNVAGKPVAQARLIEDKIAFLKAYPLISHDRARAFNYRKPAPYFYPGPNPAKCNKQAGNNGPDNQPPSLAFKWTANATAQANFHLKFKLHDRDNTVWMEGEFEVAALSADEAKQDGYFIVMKRMMQPGNYQLSEGSSGKVSLKLAYRKNQETVEFRCPDLFATKADAAGKRDGLLAWVASKRLEVRSNQPGIKKRISLLLGCPNLEFVWFVNKLGGKKYRLHYVLADKNNKPWFEGGLTLEAEAKAKGEAFLLNKACQVVMAQLANSGLYEIKEIQGKFHLVLRGNDGTVLDACPASFDTRDAAAAMRDELVAWSANERLIVVEHLLLRPKFPGDALYFTCSGDGCMTCGDEDPYSFRLTFVMPGWATPYSGNLDLRRFAERTIQQETPSHLLGKTCWVGNDGFQASCCNKIIAVLAELLIAKSLSTGGATPDDDNSWASACDCAGGIYESFLNVFESSFEDKKLSYIHQDAIGEMVAAQFKSAPKLSGFKQCSNIFDLKNCWAEIRAVMTAYFVNIALLGWQFERFEDAWFRWLEANEKFDWTEERLHENVQAIIKANLTSGSVRVSDACRCASEILAQYGMAFNDWMEENMKSGNSLEDFGAFKSDRINLAIVLGTNSAAEKRIKEFLGKRYKQYIEVSYRLRAVVNLLAGLRNAYPVATLHDCDEGSDQNPVRLNTTALGSYPLQTSYR